jgi:hypothetical protein
VIRKGIPIAARLSATGDLSRNAVEITGKIGMLTPVSRGALGWYTWRCDCGNTIRRQGANVRSDMKRFLSGKRIQPVNCGSGCPMAKPREVA